MKCTACGSPGEGSVCSYCGTQLSSSPDRQEPEPKHDIPKQEKVISSSIDYQEFLRMSKRKSKGTALILCFFLGMIGGHYFYVGNNKMGFIYLLTFGLFGLGWFVDIFRIASGSFKDVDGNWLK